MVEPRVVPDNPGYGTRTGCAHDPEDGLAALQQAGFSVTLGTGSYSGGFICAIDNAPRAGCGMVDRDTYWSYWYMLPNTDTWVYSNAGATYRTPPKGSIEAWVWQDAGDNEPPQPRSAVAPQAPPPQQPPQPGQPPDGGQGTGGGQGAGGGQDGGRAPGGDPVPQPNPPGEQPNPPAPAEGAPPTDQPTDQSTATSTSAPPSGSSAAPTSGTSTASAPPGSRSATGSAPNVAAGAHSGPASPGDTGGGGPWALAVGVLAVLLLAGGISWQIRRRRS
nr:hypothetical protein GCM10020241_46260 [Streptoalloteichus tenebrarius]